MQRDKRDRCRFWCGKTEKLPHHVPTWKISNERAKKSNEPETPDSRCFFFSLYTYTTQRVLSLRAVATSECVESSNRDPIVADMWFLFALYMRFNEIYVVCTFRRNDSYYCYCVPISKFYIIYEKLFRVWVSALNFVCDNVRYVVQPQQRKRDIASECKRAQYTKQTQTRTYINTKAERRFASKMRN